MRLIAFSDSHNHFFAARKVVDENPTVKHFLFLGDGASDIDELKTLFPQKEFFAVRGNCDGFCLYPEELMLDFDGVKVFCTTAVCFFAPPKRGRTLFCTVTLISHAATIKTACIWFAPAAFILRDTATLPMPPLI